jgi:uncharacterized OB-fold protein
MTMSAITSYITAGTEPYWEGLKEGKLLLQTCSQCQYIRHPISWLCPQCLSEEFTWEAMSGQGTVETFIWYMEHLEAATGGEPVFRNELPYNVAVIRLPEGPSLVSNVRDVSFGDLQVGQAVSASFDGVPDSEWSVLRFTLGT